MSLEKYRANISKHAHSVVNAHYVHGGYGNRPDVADGHPRFPLRTVMSPDIMSGSRRLFTASCELERVVSYCAGRCAVASGRRNSEADLHNVSKAADMRRDHRHYLWPRTVEARQVVGESCLGVPHFDCIGFVNWCIWKAAGFVTSSSIERYFHRWRDSPRLRVATGAPLMTGDLLIKYPDRPNHIAVMIDPARVAQAESTERGVTIRTLSHRPDKVLRLDAGFFLQ